MAPAVEVFADQPSGSVTSGGATTSDTAFTVSPTSAFPVASASATPPTHFYVRDTAAGAESELIEVTSCPGGTASGQSWTVVRGALGTAPVVHSSSWTAQQVIDGTWLNGVAVKAPVVVTNAAATGTVNLDPSAARVFSVTLSGNTTFTFTPLVAGLTSGQSYVFSLYLTAGSHTVTWPASVSWLGGAAPSPASLNCRR